jgi:hypothetical protein
VRTRFLLVSLFVITAAVPASAQESDGWTKRDWTLQIAYTSLHLVDWSQSLTIARNPTRHREANPILGPHPSVAEVNRYFGATLAAHWAVSALLPPKARGVWQCFTIVAEGRSVARNFSVGVRLTKSW